MEITKQDLANIHTLLDTLMETQSDAIDRAVAAVADTLAQDGMVYAFGTGHSHMLAEELFYRAGGLVKVYPILDEPLMLHSNASRSSQLERLPGYAATAISEHEPKTPRAATEIRIAKTAVRHHLPHFGVKSQNKNIENVPA